MERNEIEAPVLEREREKKSLVYNTIREVRASVFVSVAIWVTDFFLSLSLPSLSELLEV